MTEVFNLLDGEVAETPSARDGHRFRRTRLTELYDSKLTGLSVYELPPGEAAWPYHYELHREEWLIVISGEVTLRTPEGERVLRSGDVVCFPLGEAGGHAIRNDGESLARCAMPSSWREEGFVAVQPDINKALIVGPAFRKVVSLDDKQGEWPWVGDTWAT